MKKFLVLMAAVLSFNVCASTCSQSVSQISGLDKATKQTMIIQCEQAKLASIQSAPTELSESTVDKVDKWSEISLKFAKAIGVAAREVGVATNEFLGTTAGKLTATVIIWKVLGISQWTMFFLITGVTSIIIHSFLKFMRLSGYEEVETRFGKRKQAVYNSWKEMGDTEAFFAVAAYIVLIAVFVFTGVSLF